MQWIADNLFVGNRLSTGQISTSDGVRIDLRNITAPIIVFCSWGDNITPPQQALGWISIFTTTSVKSSRVVRRIVYTMHHSIGHLGIFVSGKVATKEHGEFVSCSELIDAMPPGLYEAVITEVDEDTLNPGLIQGKYLFRLEARTLGHIRALGTNDAADDTRFATVARVSEITKGLYDAFVGPAVRLAVTDQAAEASRATHPNRLRFEMFSDKNPLMQPVQALAKSVASARRPVSADNPLLAMERATSSWITTCLQTFGEYRDTMTEAVFLSAYGSPWLQALVGLGTQDATQHRIARDLVREANTARQRSELEHRFEVGGREEAVMRALIYIRLPEGSVDERGFAALKLIRASRPVAKQMSLLRFKEIVKEQFMLVSLDENRAINALPALLGSNAKERKAALDILHQVLAARGDLPSEGSRRLTRVEAMFGVEPGRVAKTEAAHA